MLLMLGWRHAAWYIVNCLDRYEGQRDMLYNQTYNLDQVAFASEGIKDAQQTVCSTASV
jgi:hypothetical protein